MEHGDTSPRDSTAFGRAMATNAFPSPPVFAGGLGGNDGCWTADATLRAAVTLQHVGDSVTSGASCSASLTQPLLLGYQELDGVDRTASGVGGATWFKLVRESLELMSAVIERRLPGTFVAKDLLPKVRCRYRHCSVLPRTRSSSGCSKWVVVHTVMGSPEFHHWVAASVLIAAISPAHSRSHTVLSMLGAVLNP